MIRKLLAWYEKNKRKLPWRKTSEPYKIWVSEIILQQTQIKTGIEYYQYFIKRFPNIQSLANANEVEILQIWQGLGYYNRALNMLVTAKIIITKYNGKFPVKYSDLIKLKGIGNYTAAAISSICANEKKAVVDGNVYRFLSRLYNIKCAINSSEGKKKFQKIANELIPNTNCGTYNQAIMEFGAIHCTKHKPKCLSCPFKKTCQSLKLNTVSLRPIKNKKTKVRTRYLNYLLIKENDHIIIQQRDKQDIWKQLYELPLIELSKTITIQQLKKENYFKTLKVQDTKHLISINHKLSHQKLEINLWEIHVKKIDLKTKMKKIHINNISHYPLPAPLKKYFDQQHLSI